MNVLIIESHPYDQSFSRQLTKAIFNVASEKNNVQVINLIDDGFNPVMTADDLKLFSKGQSFDPKVSEYQEKIKAADLIIFAFPVWWSLMPAVLKGFIDKVFLKGFAYKYDEKGMMKGILNKKAIVITTMEVSKPIYNMILKNPVKHQFILGTLSMCGIQTKKYFQIDKINSSTKEIRENEFKHIIEYFKNI